MHPAKAYSETAELMHKPIHPQSYIRVKILAKHFFHTTFGTLKNYERFWGFHQIYLGTKSIVNIFICM